MVRNAGKFGKPRRGGAKRFTDARTLKAEDQELKARGEGDDSEEESEEEEEDEESDSEEETNDTRRPIASTSGAGNTSVSTSSGLGGLAPATNNKFVVPTDRFGNPIEVTKREAKKAAAQAKAAAAQNNDGEEEEQDSDDSDDSLLNAGVGNRGVTKQLKASTLSEAKPSKKPVPQAFNRKEREEEAKKAARERYLAATRAGKTDEGKADLARLAKIRKEREEAAARRKAELAAADAAKAQALAASGRKK